MALQHTPLAPEALSPAVTRATGPSAPGPARMMAAKGLAPLPPGDLVTAIYQLCLDPEEPVAVAARKTATTLPDKILAAALDDPLDARVLDFFAQAVVERGALVEKILLNHATADETFVELAGRVGERELEIIAGNQIRVLRCPAIIEAMYFNRAARMSTVDRLVELAVRNGLTLARVPHFEAIARSILGKPQAAEEPPPQQAPEPAAKRAGQGSAMDAIFEAVLREGWDESAPEAQEGGEEQGAKDGPIRISQLSVNAKIRLATLGNMFHRAELIRDTNRIVAMAAISSPGVNEQEAAKYAADRGLSEDVIRYIANRVEWHKSYNIKVSLVHNPKTPLAFAMKFLRLLRQADVRAVARSKNVPAAVAKVAKEMGRK